MIDPITREIVQNALAAAADEMANTVYRTAYSTIGRDCLDYSTSLCNADGEMIAQGVTIPLHLGAVPDAMAALLLPPVRAARSCERADEMLCCARISSVAAARAAACRARSPPPGAPGAAP